MSPPSSGSKNKPGWFSLLCSLTTSYWFLAWLILRLRRWKRNIPPKHGLTFKGLHVVISQKTDDGQSVSLRVQPIRGSWQDFSLEVDSSGFAFIRHPLWREDGPVPCRLSQSVTLRSSLSEVYVTNFASVHIVTCRPVAGQRLGKHVPAEAYRETVGRPLLGNGTVNIITNFSETVFSVGSASRLYKGYRTQLNESQNQNENVASPRQSRKKGSAEDWLWLRVIVQEGVNKSNHPIQNPLLLVTEA
jgi:hypothetical protein